MIDEVWKPVLAPLDFRGFYEVSNLGRVRSLNRVIARNGKPATLKGRVLKPQRSTNGTRRAVSLQRDGIDLRIMTSILIAHQFLPPPQFSDAEVSHKDCDKLNDAASNLQWMTHQQNIEHAQRAGRFNPRVATKFQRKITAEIADAIRTARGRQVDIAKRHGVSPSMVSMIKSRRVWRDFHESPLAK